MKILIVSQVIYPYKSPRSYRTTELAIELSKEHDVTLVANCNDLFYKDLPSFNNIEIKPFKKLSFIRKHSNMKDSYSVLDKILIRLLWKVVLYPQIEFLWKVPISLKNLSDFDVLISIASPHTIHWGCLLALKQNPKLAKKWIADCGDPFMMNPTERPYFYFKYFEKNFMKRADFITIPFDKAERAYYPEFKSKIRVIPQGLNINNLNIKHSIINNRIITFAYAGVFYKDIRNPRKFFDFLSKLKIDFKFVVYTIDDSLINDYKSSLSDKLVIKSYIDRDVLIYELSKMDFLINFSNKHDIQMPSKLIDYALSGRPILNIDADVLNESIVCEFLNKDYKNQLSIRIDDFKIENVVKKFLNLVDETK